ncbi:MAG: ATP-binding protein [Desulfobacterales bacterium]|nr:ATP-binding protein [Desulfobacterales bacterium]
MKRVAEHSLKRWLNNKRRKPLVIRGARQVGKSTLVRQFAENNGLTLNEINLERHLALNDIFKTLDTGIICKELEGLLGRNIVRPDSLLFLDEIQATPRALQALRYFYEDLPGTPVIAAGSLLEFVLSRHNLSMPVGRIEYAHMGPMTFEEYLAEIDEGLLKYILEFDFSGKIPTTAHKKLLDRQREFLMIGGMPEAVSTFLESGQFSDVIPVQRSILSTYLDDFSKYASQKALLRLQKVFNFVPRSVGKKIKYSNISRDEASRELRTAIELLSKARVISPVFHSHCSGLPLQSEIDEFTYKALFLDIGLMNRVSGLDWLSISALDERTLVNEGAMAEQFIGQHLLYFRGWSEPPELCYWLRQKKTANAEVDYVISRGDLITPVEVKAGKSGTLKSLLQFAYSKKARLGVRFDLNPPSTQHLEHSLRQANSTRSVKYDLISLPLYMVGRLAGIIDLYRTGRLN